MDGGDPAEALAGLTFGLSALSGILLDQVAVAEATGRDQVQILADIHRYYLTHRARARGVTGSRRSGRLRRNGAG